MRRILRLLFGRVHGTTAPTFPATLFPLPMGPVSQIPPELRYPATNQYSPVSIQLSPVSIQLSPVKPSLPGRYPFSLSPTLAVVILWLLSFHRCRPQVAAACRRCTHNGVCQGTLARSPKIQRRSKKNRASLSTKAEWLKLCSLAQESLALCSYILQARKALADNAQRHHERE